MLFWRDPVPFAAIIASVLLAHHFVARSQRHLDSVRSFFGVLKVNETSNGRFRTLSHGTTLHGGQRIRDNDGNPVTGRPEPTMYYYDGSAIAQSMDAARAARRRTDPLRGDRARHRQAGLPLPARRHACTITRSIRRWSGISSDPGNFTFLTECGPDVPIMMGDARLTLAEAPDGATTSSSSTRSPPTRSRSIC